MNTLPAALVAAKNDLSSTGAVITLAKIVLPDQTLRFADNEQDVVWDSNTWQRFAFDVTGIGDSSKGEIPRAAIKVSNESRAMIGYLENLDGLVDGDVTIYLVHSAHLAETTPLAEHVFTVLNTSADQNMVTLELGASNPLNKRVPRSRVRKNYCRFRFKGAGCQYSMVALDVDMTGGHFSPTDVITGNLSGAFGTVDSVYTYSYNSELDCVNLTSVTGTFQVGETVAIGGTNGTVIHSDTCPKALENCRGRQNSVNFGGFPGAGKKGVRLYV